MRVTLVRMLAIGVLLLAFGVMVLALAIGGDIFMIVCGLILSATAMRLLDHPRS